jgi:hypothetical protein
MADIDRSERQKNVKPVLTVCESRVIACRNGATGAPVRITNNKKEYVMRMTTGLKASCAVLASAGVLVACAKLSWMVKYQDADLYYSLANTTAVDNLGNAYLAGYIQARDTGQEGRVPFVAEYNANGELKWDYRFAQTAPDNPIFGVKQLVTGPDNALYTIEPRVGSSFSTMGFLVTKFDAAGNMLWQQHERTESYLFTLLQADFRSDGNLYIASTGIDLLTLSPDGNLVWVYHPPVVPPPDRGELPPFTERFTALAIDSAYTARNLHTRLEMVNASGEVLATFDAAQLTLGSINYVYTRDNITTVVGSANGGLLARRISNTAEGFAVDVDHSLSLPDAWVSFNSQAGGFCYADIVDKKVMTGFVDQDLVQRWQYFTEPETAANDVYMVDVEATGGRCHIQYQTSALDDVRTKVLVSDAQTGQSFPPVVIRDFAGADISVRGRAIYQAGITGSYETIDGTAATLAKNTVR